VLDVLLRALIGGVVVSLFAILGDVIQPTSLGGTTAAAPAIALASMGLMLHKEGVGYTAIEARSMVAGAVAFFVYATLVSYVQMRRRPRALVSASLLMPVWFGVAAVLWAVWLRR
jgi:uncharacterized membrane protein (GlpM family)